jgi:hypothetical protein
MDIEGNPLLEQLVWALTLADSGVPSRRQRRRGCLASPRDIIGRGSTFCQIPFVRDTRKGLIEIGNNKRGEGCNNNLTQK